MIDVKIHKVHPNAVIPTYAHPGDAGMDVTAVAINVTDDYIEYDTGLQFQLPSGYVMLIFPRSSNSKKDLLLTNSVGVLDSGYTGNLKLRYKRSYRIEQLGTNYTLDSSAFETNISPTNLLIADKYYNIGDRVGQIMIIPYPEINFIETEIFEDTERGSRGFGSTGK